MDDLRCEGDWTRLLGGAGDGVRLDGDITRTTGRPGIWQGSWRVKKFSRVSHPPPTRTIMCVPFNNFKNKNLLHHNNFNLNFNSYIYTFVKLSEDGFWTNRNQMTTSFPKNLNESVQALGAIRNDDLVVYKSRET